MSAVLGHCAPGVVAHGLESVAPAGPPVQRDAQPPRRRAGRPARRRPCPTPLGKTLLLSTGAESNEAAIKMAKLYTGRYEIVSFDRSWHGMTQGAAAATFSAGDAATGRRCRETSPCRPRTPTGPRSGHADGSYDWETELDVRLRDGRPAVRPGASPPASSSRSCPPAASSSCRRATCAGSRSSARSAGCCSSSTRRRPASAAPATMYAFERDGVVPDILTLSKTLGAGLPVAAWSPRPRSRRPATSGGSSSTRRTSPTRWRPRSALTVLDVVEREDWSRGRRARRTAPRPACWTCGTGTRSSATCAAVACCRASSWCGTRRPRRRPTRSGSAVTAACLERGLHINIVQLPGMGGIFRIAPPLTISEDELHGGVDILEASLTAVTAG